MGVGFQLFVVVSLRSFQVCKIFAAWERTSGTILPSQSLLSSTSGVKTIAAATSTSSSSAALKTSTGVTPLCSVTMFFSLYKLFDDPLRFFYVLLGGRGLSLFLTWFIQIPYNVLINLWNHEPMVTTHEHLVGDRRVALLSVTQMLGLSRAFLRSPPAYHNSNSS